jgi:hypothetical protein
MNGIYLYIVINNIYDNIMRLLHIYTNNTIHNYSINHNLLKFMYNKEFIEYINNMNNMICIHNNVKTNITRKLIII